MQNRFTFARCLAFSACLLPVTLPAAVLQKLSPRVSVPVGLEKDFAGTSLQVSKGIANVEALIRDPAGEAHLAAGASQLIFKFSRQAVLSQLSFVNDGMEGELRLSASPDGRQWAILSSERFAAADRQVSVSPGCAQGRFMKLEFDSLKGGTIRCLHLQGGDSDLNYQVVQDGDGHSVNFASGLGGGRMIYATPADNADQLMVVYDLGQARELTEFASVHSRQPADLKVYAMSSLPQKEDWRGRLQADPAQIGQPGQFVAEVSDTFGSGHMRVRLTRPVTTRYLAMVWQSQIGLAGFKTYDIVASGPGRVTQVNLSEVVAEFAEATLQSSTGASGADKSQSAPLLDQVVYHQESAGTMAYFSNSFGAGGVSAGVGSMAAKVSNSSARRLSKALDDPPPDEEIPEFAGPAFGIEWCLSPSAQ